MKSKVFEVVCMVGASGAERATIRVNAEDGIDAGKQAEKLLVGFKRVWEINEVPKRRATGGLVSLDVDSNDGTVLWAGWGDSDAPLGHGGTNATIVVDGDGEILIELRAPGSEGRIAPIDWREEALALRAGLRSMAVRLLELGDEEAEVEEEANPPSIAQDTPIEAPSGKPFRVVGTETARDLVGFFQEAALQSSACHDVSNDDIDSRAQDLIDAVVHRDHLAAQAAEAQTSNTALMLRVQEQAEELAALRADAAPSRTPAVMSTKATRFGVAVAVARDGAGGGPTEILWGKRLGGHGAGTWGFPGGEVHEGESIEEAAVRELREETGIEVALGDVKMLHHAQAITRPDGERWICLIATVRVDREVVSRLMEPEKCEGWVWLDVRDRPSPMFETTQVQVSDGVLNDLEDFD